MSILQQELFEREISHIDDQLHRLKMQAKRIGKHAVWGDDTLGNHIKHYEEKRAALMRELGEQHKRAPKTCGQTIVVPGEHGQGVEQPCTNLAAYRLRGFTICAKCLSGLIEELVLSTDELQTLEVVSSTNGKDGKA